MRENVLRMAGKRNVLIVIVLLPVAIDLALRSYMYRRPPMRSFLVCVCVHVCVCKLDGMYSSVKQKALFCKCVGILARKKMYAKNDLPRRNIHTHWSHWNSEC